MRRTRRRTLRQMSKRQKRSGTSVQMSSASFSARALLVACLFVATDAFSFRRPKIFRYVRNRIRPVRRVVQREGLAQTVPASAGHLDSPVSLSRPPVEMPRAVSSQGEEDRRGVGDFYSAFVEGLFTTSATLMPRLSQDKLESKGFPLGRHRQFDFDVSIDSQRGSMLHEFLSSSEARRRGFTSARVQQPFEVVGFMDVDASTMLRPARVKPRATTKSKQKVKGANNILSLDYWRSESGSDHRNPKRASTTGISSLPVTDHSCDC